MYQTELIEESGMKKVKEGEKEEEDYNRTDYKR